MADVGGVGDMGVNDSPPLDQSVDQVADHVSEVWRCCHAHYQGRRTMGCPSAALPELRSKRKDAVSGPIRLVRGGTPGRFQQIPRRALQVSLV